MRGAYSPTTRTIELSPDATMYTRFHEFAHKELHDSHPVIFNILLFCRCVRFLEYVATMLLELDAHFRARARLIKIGMWNDEACKEGRNNLISYAMRKENT